MPSSELVHLDLMKANDDKLACQALSQCFSEDLKARATSEEEKSCFMTPTLPSSLSADNFSDRLSSIPTVEFLASFRGLEYQTRFEISQRKRVQEWRESSFPSAI
ncbi:hypothetical protein CEXT_111161 [Caerostris extrusa]|uniref:Uncharacterized protein n=1 Tax=Caerostris extrusa TaxID=172846 RepID=A0AAV4MXE8_CAEEX|nr:hypothetical protein CEXT_111161 [Caerostris extrusa]